MGTDDLVGDIRLGRNEHIGMGIGEEFVDAICGRKKRLETGEGDEQRYWTPLTYSHRRYLSSGLS